MKILKKGCFYKIIGCVEIDIDEQPVEGSTELCTRVDGIYVINEEDIDDDLEVGQELNYFEVDSNEEYLTEELDIQYDITVFGSLENRDFEGTLGNDGEYMKITNPEEISKLEKTLLEATLKN